MERILILGARGALGHQLVKTFADLQVTAWDREEIDLGNRIELEKKILSLRPEVVINAAAYNDVDRAETEPELARLINGEAVGWLAKICQKIDAAFVHYSTDYVFKGDKQEGYKEDDEPAPQSEYAKSKRLGEKYLLDLAADHPDFNFYLIRTSRLFGPSQTFASQNLDWQAVASKPSFVEVILELAKEKPRLQVIDEEVSAPTYTCDLAEATRRLLSFYPPGIYHITNFGACTWHGWAKKILELAKIDKPLDAVAASKLPRPAVRPAHSVLLNTKLPPLRSWEDALKDYLEHKAER